jgi:AcrR family transcriptional regulator
MFIPGGRFYGGQVKTVPKVPATAKGEATRAFLLRTAAQVFAERGYVAATQNELIAASGLTKGAFYFYFRSKADLALAVLQEQKGRWLTEVGERVLAQPNPAAQLRELVPAMLALISTDPSAWSITRLSRELATEPDVAEHVSASTAQWVGFIADIVRRGQAGGSLRRGLDPGAVAAVLVGSFDGLKALVDVLEPPERAGQVFAERVQTLLAIVDTALVVPKRRR